MSSLLWTVLLFCVTASYAADTPKHALGEDCRTSDDCANLDKATPKKVECDITKKCKLRSGGQCSAGHSENCVEGANCTASTTICTCRPGFFTEEKSTGLCKVLPKRSCVPYKNVNPCAWNYECIAGSCQCPDELYYVDGSSICSPRLRVGVVCNVDAQNCVRNATCIDTTSTSSVDGIPASQTSTTSTEAPTKASTEASTEASNEAPSEAPTEAFTEAFEEAPTEAANEASNEAPGFARREADPTCSCQAEYFKTNENFCNKRKKVGATCKEAKECWHDVHCIEGRCQCNPELQYVFQDQCFSRVKVNNECRSEIQNECIKNATCVDNYCKCIEGYYLSKGTCQPTIGFNETCDDKNGDENQCESNTVCVSTKTCKCKSADDFFNGEKCNKRVLASFPCPYLPGDQSRIDLDRQCVNNAECDDTRICKCDTAGYFMRAGYCVPRIGKDEMCDSWSGYRNQCINGLECIYGMCLEKNTQIG